MGTFDTTDGGDFFDSKDDLLELQDALLENRMLKSFSGFEKGADPDTHGALHMAMQNPSQVSDTVVQAFWTRVPARISWPISRQIPFLMGFRASFTGPLDVSLSEDELGGLEPPVAQAYQDAVSALVQAGGKHTNAYQAGVKGKEEVFHPDQEPGGSQCSIQGSPHVAGCHPWT